MNISKWASNWPIFNENPIYLRSPHSRPSLSDFPPQTNSRFDTLTTSLIPFRRAHDHFVEKYGQPTLTARATTKKKKKMQIKENREEGKQK